MEPAPHAARNMAESLADFFVDHFSRHAHDCAYRQKRGYSTESFTYAAVLDLASRCAAEVNRRGIRKGERVMLWGANCAEWVSVFFGCALSGAVVVPMDDGSSPDFATRVAQQVEPRLLVASREHMRDWKSSSDPTQALILEDLQQIPREHLRTIPTAELKPTDTLQIVFTSGTPADPKGVVITHANVLANIAPLQREMQQYLKYERIVHPVRFLNLLPLSHVFGQFLGMFLPPILGGTVIFQQELRPSEIVDTICRERVSVLVSVPRVLQSLKQKLERDLGEQRLAEKFRELFKASAGKHFLHRWWIFRSIRRQFGWKFWAFISGGAALDTETEEFWGRLGYAVIQGYGLTETTSLISVNHPFKLGKGSIGKVLPGPGVKVAEDGEILVRGGGVASGYWERGTSENVSDEQGWYRTGDIGALDAAGNLYFKGRKKEVLVTPAGTNVYPEDLEQALRREPEVKDCVVVGVEREGNAEPCAVIILRNHGDVKSVVQRANESLADYQRMRMWMEWPRQDFPRTSTQKPRRNVIAEALRASVNAGEKPLSGDGNPLADLISRISGRSVPELRPDATLDSYLGLNSLNRVELMSALEDRYQIDLSETRFNAVLTVSDIEQMLHREVTP